MCKAGSNSHANRPNMLSPSTIMNPTGSIFSRRALVRRWGLRVIIIVQCGATVNRRDRCQHPAPNEGHQDICRGAGKRHRDHGATRITQRAGCHRHSLGPAEERGAEGKQETGNQDGADGIQVAQRVQTQSSQHLGSAVAEVSGYPAMRDFVQRDGKQHRDCVDRNVPEKYR